MSIDGERKKVIDTAIADLTVSMSPQRENVKQFVLYHVGRSRQTPSQWPTPTASAHAAFQSALAFTLRRMSVGPSDEDLLGLSTMATGILVLTRMPEAP